MKVNEAPKKIYLQENTTTDCYGEFWPEWFEARNKGTVIEYTRTDAFIEKAIEFMKNVNLYLYNCISEECDYVDADKLIEDFKKYMEGE